jgi:hypothetical protein
MGFHGRRKADPRWGDSGYNPAKGGAPGHHYQSLQAVLALLAELMTLCLKESSEAKDPLSVSLMAHFKTRPQDWSKTLLLR